MRCGLSVCHTPGKQGELVAPFDEAQLRTFIHAHRWPPIVRLTQAIYTRALEETRPLLLLLASPSRPKEVRQCARERERESVSVCVCDRVSCTVV